MASEQSLQAHKVTTIASLLLSFYGNARYLVGRLPVGGNGAIDVADTPFTGNIFFNLGYWILFYLLATGFVSLVFLPSFDNHGERASVVTLVGWHFTVFNLLSFLWSYLFANGHYFFSELVLWINFFNVLSLYFSHKTYSIKPIKRWLIIHLPVTAFPLSWTFFAIFWNGAVLFHVHKFLGRILSNILIWEFLLFPAVFILVYNDWAIGISSAILTFSLAFGQLFTKLFALQWIFAFIIASLLLILSLIAAAGGSLVEVKNDEESAPLIENN